MTNKVTLCSFCGYNQFTITRKPNGGFLFVAEEFEMCTECYDADVVAYTWNTCKETFYAKDNDNGNI